MFINSLIYGYPLLISINIYIVATMFPMSRFVKSIVEEKETKMRELMKVMGLNSSIHQLSWAITGFMVFFWIALSTTYVSHVTFLPNSNPALLFAYFFLFMISLFLFFKY